jgi:hypothetical protein
MYAAVNSRNPDMVKFMYNKTQIFPQYFKKMPIITGYMENTGKNFDEILSDLEDCN